jgi:hypothetical protein
MEVGASQENRDPAHRWDVIDRAARGDELTDERPYGMDSAAFHRRFAAEIAEGKAEWETHLRHLTDEIASLEGAEAVYLEKYSLCLVHVTRIRALKRSISARIELIPRVKGEKEHPWSVGCDWPNFHDEPLLWISQCQGADWKIFFAQPVINQVRKIQSSFPSTDTFRPYDSHFLELVQPLRTFLVEKASNHVRGLTEQLDSIENEKGALPELRAALEGITVAFRSYPTSDGIGKLLTFIGAADDQVGRSLSTTEAGQLIRRAYLVGRVFGGPF